MLATYPYSKITVENSSCGPDTEINGSGPSIKYYGWPKIVDAIGLMNLSTMDSLELPRALSTVVVNDISKLSTINASGGVSFPTFYFLCPGRNVFGVGFIPGFTNIVRYWYFNFFCGIGATYLKTI